MIAAPRMEPPSLKPKKPAAMKKKLSAPPALSGAAAAAAAAYGKSGEGDQKGTPKGRLSGAAMLFHQEEIEIAQKAPPTQPVNRTAEPTPHKSRADAPQETLPPPPRPVNDAPKPARPEEARKATSRQEPAPEPRPSRNAVIQQAVREAARHEVAPGQHERVWEQCLRIIHEHIEPRAFKVWFQPIRAVALDGHVLTLQVPSQFFYEWLEEHYVELLGKTIKRMLGKEGRLEYRIVMDSRGQSQQPTTMQVPGTTQPPPPTGGNLVELPPHVKDPFAIVNPYSIPGLKRVQIDSQLNPKLTFERFVEGDCNRLARGAAMHVAEKPGSSAFNPLVLFGGTGWGKTHLAHAIGNEVRRLHPGKTVLYVSTEKFITQYIEHARTNAINDFVHFYQLIDVLIVDDIHYFSPAQKTQDAFFNIFNHLHQSGKQIVLTCDTAPKDLNGLQDRLLSRFKWGLNADIQQPGYETRTEILRLKMSNEGVEFPEEVVEYVAQHVTGNVRELESAVIGLLAQSMINKKDVDLSIAKRMVKNLVKIAAEEEEISMTTIIRAVCAHYQLAEDQILKKSRRREVVQARQTVMFLARKLTKGSLKVIGREIGGYDHTTVLHACKQAENLMDTNPTYRTEVEELTERIQLGL